MNPPRRCAGWFALALVLGWASGARAAEETLCLKFEGPWPASLSALIDSDLRTAFGRRRVTVCPEETPEADRAATPLLTLEIASEAMDRVNLTLDPRSRPTLDRQLNLTPFPADGRVLALVVAADELLQASRERPGEPPPPTAPPPPAAARAPTIVRTRVTPPAPPRQSLAVGFAVDGYTGGQTQLGPDVTWRLRFTEALFVSVAGQARRGLTADAQAGTVSSRLIGGRVALGARFYARRPEGDRHDRVALTADLGVRGGRIWFEGEPATGGVVGSTATGWLLYADVMLALDLRVAGPVMLRLAAGAGAPLVAQAADDGTHAITAASGLALQAQASALMVF